MKNQITLTEDHCKLLQVVEYKNMVQKNEFGEVTGEFFTVNKTNPYMLSGYLSDLAFVLGLKDKAIPGTETDELGAAFLDDVEQYILDTHHYIVDNFEEIESLIHYMVFRGGIKPGSYRYDRTNIVWERVED